MATKRITDLTAAVSLALTDFLEIDTGAASLKITGQQIVDLISVNVGTGTAGHGVPVALKPAGSTYLDLDTQNFYASTGAAWIALIAA